MIASMGRIGIREPKVAKVYVSYRIGFLEDFERWDWEDLMRCG
jgi:hypothetical protein